LTLVGLGVLLGFWVGRLMFVGRGVLLGFIDSLVATGAAMVAVGIAVSVSFLLRP